MSEERLRLENELLMTCSKAQAINKYIDELEESSKLSELWCKSQQENKELHNKIDKAIEIIHTQMKNNPSYKENLKIIENNLIKGSCKVCDLKDSDVDE